MKETDLTYIYRTFYLKTKGYTFFSAPHGTSPKLINRYKNIEIIPCTLSDHHGLRLIFKSNISNRKPKYAWKLNNNILNNSVKEEIMKERL
jgi:hypothetical protein